MKLAARFFFSGKMNTVLNQLSLQDQVIGIGDPMTWKEHAF